jgi:hypothetical protein
MRWGGGSVRRRAAGSSPEGGSWRLRLAPRAAREDERGEGAPNREMVADWWVSPWRGETVMTAV